MTAQKAIIVLVWSKANQQMTQKAFSWTPVLPFTSSDVGRYAMLPEVLVSLGKGGVILRWEGENKIIIRESFCCVFPFGSTFENGCGAHWRVFNYKSSKVPRCQSSLIGMCVFNTNSVACVVILMHQKWAKSFWTIFLEICFKFCRILYIQQINSSDSVNCA